MSDEPRDVEALVVLFDATRKDHQIDVMQSNLLACCCGESLPIQYDANGQPLYNPAIRHHHERAAQVIIASDWLAEHIAARLEQVERERDDWAEMVVTKQVEINDLRERIEALAATWEGDSLGGDRYCAGELRALLKDAP